MLANKSVMPLVILLSAIGTANAAESQPRTDWYGDPLPPGALARLGTSRLRHNSPTVVFSPDGKELISAGEDGMLRFWELTTGKEKRHVRVQSADSSGRPSAFAANGKSVAGTASNSIRVWDTATGKELNRFPLEGGCWRLALSPDGKKLAAILCRNGIASADVHLWDVSAGKKLRKLKAWAYHNQLVFSPDGKLLGVSDQSQGLYLWDTATGKEVRHIAEARGGLVFSRDGKWAAAVTPAGGVKAWSLIDGKECWHIKLAPGLHPIAPSLAADGKIMAIGIYDQQQEGIGQIWDIAARKQICTIPVWNQCLLLSPDGNTAATFTENSAAIHVWDAATGKEIGRRAGHEGGASFAIARDGSTIATFGTHKVYLWDSATGRPIRQLAAPQWTSQGVFSTDGKFLVTGSWGQNILRVWDRETGKEARRILLESSDPTRKIQGIVALAVSSDGKRLLSVDSTWQLLVWDIATGKRLERRNDVSQGGIPHFSADARSIAHSRNADVVVEDAVTGQVSMAVLGYEPLALSPDGQILAVANRTPKPRESKINVIDLMELASGKRLLRIDARPDGFDHLAYSPDGRTLATVDSHRFRIWDAITGKELFRRELPVKYCIRISYSFAHSLAFLPGGDRLATGLADSTTLIWDLQPKSWHTGIDGRSPEHRDLERLWSDLAADDAAKAHRAVWTLATIPDKAVPFLKDHLHPMSPPDAKLVQRLIADLDSPEFAIRRDANKALAFFGEQIELALRQALANKPTLEARRRLEWLHKDAVMAGRNVVRSAERLRALRAIRALEQIGDQDARKVLRTVAGGDPEARQTRSAKEALHRLESRR